MRGEEDLGFPCSPPPPLPPLPRGPTTHGCAAPRESDALTIVEARHHQAAATPCRRPGRNHQTTGAAPPWLDLLCAAQPRESRASPATTDRGRRPGIQYSATARDSRRPPSPLGTRSDATADPASGSGGRGDEGGRPAAARVWVSRAARERRHGSQEFQLPGNII
jgi:hypothetical protein